MKTKSYRFGSLLCQVVMVKIGRSSWPETRIQKNTEKELPISLAHEKRKFSDAVSFLMRCTSGLSPIPGDALSGFSTGNRLKLSGCPFLVYKYRYSDSSDLLPSFLRATKFITSRTRRKRLTTGQNRSLTRRYVLARSTFRTTTKGHVYDG
jgi:hypothetical protein